MEHISLALALPLDILARAGGGGSSSGGSGDGSLLVIIGYLPMHFIGAKLRHYGSNNSNWLLFQAAGWLLCAIYSILLFGIGIAGSFAFLGFMTAVCAVLGTGAGLYNWFSLLRRNKKVDLALKASASADPAWNEASVLDRVNSVFMSYQADWSARNWQAMSAYMTPRYLRHASLMVSALVQARRINDVQNPVISEAVVVDMVDSPDDSEDTFVVIISAKANDRLIDDIDNSLLFTDNKPFMEYWKFKRQGTEWMLDGIEQATAAGWLHDSELQKFAESNGYFYSLDWGWLLIPRRGALFGSSKFGTSDINNHVIGVYNQYYLLQLYSYSPTNKNLNTYLIAQTNLPKTYGNILVRRKKTFQLFAPRGLRRISMEWGDFNKKYEVFTSSSEGAVGFELLHPSFMEKLEALPFEVNIEVVDNVVYLYAPQKQTVASAANYSVMLEILREAYKQMKL